MREDFVMRHRTQLIAIILIILFSMPCFCWALPGKKLKREVPLKESVNGFYLILTKLKAQLKKNELNAAKITLERLTTITKKISEEEIPERLASKSNKIKQQKEALTSSVNNLSLVLNKKTLTKVNTEVMNVFHKMVKDWKKINNEIRVEVAEMTAFHDVLSPVWHVHYVNNDITEIKKAAPGLKEKAAVLDNVQWPEILLEEEDLEILNANAIELKKAVDEFAAVCQSEDIVAIKKMTAKVKLKYQNIKKMQ